MPVIYDKSYKPKGIWKNGHLNSILSNRFRKVDFMFEVQRKITFDGDFIELGWKCQRSTSLTILIHGLEGSMESTYIKGLARALYAHGMDICAISLRGCSGDLDQLNTFYHSGFTQDLEQVVNEEGSSYDQINIVGFSLGGNMLLKYLGDDRIIRPTNLHKAMAISVPTRLADSCAHIDKTVYRKLFIKSLKEKGYAYEQANPGSIDINRLNNVKSLFDFDDTVTAPAHGFNGAKDYYDQSSSASFIRTISIPTVIINSLDDPFFPVDFNPIDEAQDNELVTLILTSGGGHVGFYLPSEKRSFVESKAMDFLI